MKRIIAICLILVTMLGLVACFNPIDPQTTTTTTTNKGTTSSNTTKHPKISGAF